MIYQYLHNRISQNLPYSFAFIYIEDKYIANLKFMPRLNTLCTGGGTGLHTQGTQQCALISV